MIFKCDKNILFICFLILSLTKANDDIKSPLDVIKDGASKVLEKKEEISETVKELQVCVENGKMCTTPGCIHAASSLLDKMDMSVDPCNDFYQFSCGQFLEKTTIPDDKIYVNSFSIVGDLLQEQLKSLITSPVSDKDIEPFKMVKNLYLACMNESFIENRGLSPLKDIHEKLGGFPVVLGNEWNESGWNWQNTLKLIRNNGYSTDYLIDFSVDTDLKNSSRHLINIDQTDFGLDIEFLLKGIENPIVKAYLNYQIDIAVQFGADKERAEKEMMDALEFEIGLANISLTNDKRRDAEAFYNPITIKDLQTKHSYIDWLRYFNSMLPDGVNASEDETILIYVPSFFNQLGGLLEKTSKRTIANYLISRATADSITYTTKSLKDRQLQFKSALSGQEDKEPRWKECIDITSSNLPTALSAMFVRKYFKEESKKSALEMVNTIKKEFEDILKNIKWMGEKTREAALKKINTMNTHIGHPDELMDDQKLTEFYKAVKVDDDKYLESILSIKRFDTDRDFNKLHLPVNKSDWVKLSKQAQVNAFYSSLENSIKFPAGILQHQFYSPDRPLYMNYAAIGSIIGHEITHGFDDRVEYQLKFIGKPWEVDMY